MRSRPFVAALVACVSIVSAATCTPPFSITLFDLNGKMVRPLDATGARGIVLIFIAKDCPISNSYSPEINRLFAYCRANDLKMQVVDTDQSAPLTDIARHAKEYGYVGPVLLDRKQALARAVGATVTPEAVVLDGAGQIAYRGRIDNRYVDFGQVRPAATVRDVRDAIDALLAGRKPPHPRTKAVGCVISTAG